MRALAQEAKALTADCVITSGKVKTAAAHDGDYTTAWRSERVRRPYLEFELPEGETAGYLYVCFTEMPQSWAVEERVDGKWRVVAEGGTDYLHALVELNGQNHFRIVENSGVTTRLKFNEVFVFGEGVKSGELNYVVYKGLVFKTYEGKLIQSGIRSKTAGTIQSYEFEFSVENEALARKLMLLGGKNIELHYKEYFGALPWRGFSKFVVDSIVTKPIGSLPIDSETER